MGYAPVSIGTAVTGAAPLAPAFGQPTTARNLLVAWACTNSSSTTDPFTTPAGWTAAGPVGGTQFEWAKVFYKANCGAGEAAPQFAIAAGPSFSAAMLGEFSGAPLAGPLDRYSVAHGAPMPAATMPGADTAGGDLLIFACGYNGNNGPTTISLTMTDSSGAAVTVHETDNATTTGGLYYSFGWGIAGTAHGASADSAQGTIGLFAAGSASFASFAPAPSGSGLLMAAFP